MWVKDEKTKCSYEISRHVRLLRHRYYGVTELRIFNPRPMVAYADSIEAVVRLCLEMYRKTSGIYIGVQPRVLDLFDKAPNCWRHACSAPNSNCACDRDIEYITVCFFDIDVVSEARAKGHPASEEELDRSYYAARLLSQEEGFALSSTICCSGNGHYVLAPVLPISVFDKEVAIKFQRFCQQVANKIAAQVEGVKIDPVYNLSQVMLLMGSTVNHKSQATPERPHRVAHFVTKPVQAKSFALYHMILNTEIPSYSSTSNTLQQKIKCDLSKIEECEFIKWCRKYPLQVTEPQWFALATNLANLEGGQELFYEISRLDMFRYNHQQTQRLIERVLNRGYNPVGCEKIKASGFPCPKLKYCHVRAPIYLTGLFSIWKG